MLGLGESDEFCVFMSLCVALSLAEIAEFAMLWESGNKDTWLQFTTIFFGWAKQLVLWSFIALELPH